MIAEKFEGATTYAEEAISSMGDYLHRGTDQVSHIVDERPAGALVMACLAGFGVGILLSRAFSADDSHVGAFSRSRFDRKTAERLGRNILDRLESSLPSTLRGHLFK